MALAGLRSVRFGVLISIGFTALLLWVSAAAPWWTERTNLGGSPASAVDLAGFGGSGFAWCAAVACLAFAVAAVPVPRRVRRPVLAAGLVAAAGAGAGWTVLRARVLRWDAGVHRGWAAEIWRRHAGGDDLTTAQTAADGLNVALVAVFLLLVIGGVLAVPRRHERTVLLVAAMVNIVAAVTTSTATAWVTTGPRTAEPEWVRMPELIAASPTAAVTLAVMLPILGAGLLARPSWRPIWAVPACIYCYLAYFVTGIDFLESPPLNLNRPAHPAGLPNDWGVAVSGLLILVIFLPLLVVVRVVWANSAAVKRAAREALRSDLPTDHREPVPDPEPVVSYRVPDDPPPATGRQ